MLDKTSELLKRTVSADANENIWRRGGLLYMLGINYRPSPIVIDTVHRVDKEAIFDPYNSGMDINAGDRAPEAPGLFEIKGGKGETVSLFKVFNYVQHTALIFTQDIPAVTSVISKLKVYGDRVRTVIILSQGTRAPVDISEADYILEDTVGHAYKAYIDNERPFTVVIVRPDTYIGAIASDESAIVQYFEKIYL